METCDSLTSPDLYGQVIKYNNDFYYLEWYYNYYSKYIDTAIIHHLTPQGFGDSITIYFHPKTFQYKNIYNGNAESNTESIGFAKDAVSAYVEEMLEELMTKSEINDNVRVHTGDEELNMDNDKGLRLKSVGGHEDYYKIDFNNDGVTEYISRHYWFPSNSTSMTLLLSAYQFTEERIVEIENNFKSGEGLLVQTWFKEFDGKVFTFKLFLHHGYNYVLNVSLIEGENVTQVQSYIVVPRREFNITYMNKE